MEPTLAPLPGPDAPTKLEALALNVAAQLVLALTELAGRGLEFARRGMQDLPLAEALVRRLIYLMALRLDPPVPAPRATAPAPVIARSPATEAPRKSGTPRFRLIEAELTPRNPRPLLKPAECPRITLMDSAARAFIPDAPASAAPGPRPGLEYRFMRRAQALSDALAHLDDYAVRMACWIAQQKAEGAPRQSPLGIGPAPEHVEIAKSDPAYPVLSDIGLLVEAVLGPDTS
jgi:hypothetical protein